MNRHPVALMATLLTVGSFIGCNDSSPTNPQQYPGHVDLIYVSSVVPGDRDDPFVGHCLRSARNRVAIYDDDGLRVEPFMGYTANVGWTASITGLPLNTTLYAFIKDAQCCTYAESQVCEPVEHVYVNNVLLTKVVRTQFLGGRPGLAFRLNSRGRIKQ